MKLFLHFQDEVGLKNTKDAFASTYVIITQESFSFQNFHKLADVS